MAQVKTNPDMAALLDRADSNWRQLGDVFSAWDTLSDDEQVLYSHEVPLYIDQFARLESYERQGRIGGEEHRRLKQLAVFVQRLRPRLRELTGYDLAGDP